MSNPGEQTTIPIPRQNAGVEQLLEEMQSDEDNVVETDTDALEDDVNDVVYEMFSITQDEQDVIEEYLETFRVY